MCPCRLRARLPLGRPLRLRRTGIVNETGHHIMISSNSLTISRAVGHFLDKFALARMRLLLSRRTVPISAIEPE
jgi:hypothetical protein